MPRTLALALLTSIAIAAPAHLSAATIMVSTTADDLTVNGNCTLREAVVASNTDAPVDRCRSGAGPDAIVLPPGTYTLALVGPNDDAALSGDLDIAGNTVIQGAGTAVTVIEGGALDYWTGDRVVHVLASARVTLFGATVRGGLCGAGAGILNAGTLSLIESLVEQNYSGMYYDNCNAVAEGISGFGGGGVLNTSTGVLTVTASRLAANSAGYDDIGGSLANFGRAVIERTSIADSSAAGGAGIWNAGTLDMVDSRMSGNFGRFYGAAVVNASRATIRRTTIDGNYTGGSGGAIVNAGWDDPSASLTIDTSTVSGNVGYSASGALVNYAGALTVVSSTLAGNVSPEGVPAVLAQAAITLKNTILFSGTVDCSGSFVSLGNNLDGDGSCGLTAAGDLPATDPMLGPLADNGGPTPTHALLAGSPAIDHIPVPQCSHAADQRHIMRPYPASGNCDIGAYEFSAPGEIRAIGDQVKLFGRSRLISRVQERSLLQSLKPAELAAMHDDAARALSGLADFSSAVSGYVTAGTMNAAIGQELMADAARVAGLFTD